jgi:hypothetical protein
MTEKQTRKQARLMKSGEKCVFALKSEKVATLSPEGPKLYEIRARKDRHIFYRLADSPVEAEAWAEEHFPRKLGGYRSVMPVEAVHISLGADGEVWVSVDYRDFEGRYCTDTRILHRKK